MTTFFEDFCREIDAHERLYRQHPLFPSFKRWAGRQEHMALRLDFRGEEPTYLMLHARTVTAEQAKFATQSFLDIVAGGKKAMIRALPTEPHEETEFDTKATWWESMVRFSVWSEAGEWILPEPEREERYMYGFGDLLKGADRDG